MGSATGLPPSREGGHRSGTVPESHRLRDHAAWVWVARRSVAQAHLDAARRPNPDKRPISAACDHAGLASARRLPPPGEVKDMAEHRWLRAIGPGVIALVAVIAIGSSTQAARDRPSLPLACDGSAGSTVAAVRGMSRVTLADLGNWRMDAPRSDAGFGRRPDRPAPGDRHPRSRIGEGHGVATGVVRRRAVRTPAPGRRRRRHGDSAVRDRRGDRLHIGHRRGDRCRPTRDDRSGWRRALRESRRPDDAGGSRGLAAPARPIRPRDARRRPDPGGCAVRTDVVDRVHLVARRRPSRDPVMRRDGVPHARPRAGGRRSAGPPRRRPVARLVARADRAAADRLRGLPRSPLPDLVGGCRLGRPCAARRGRRPGHARRRRSGCPGGPRVGRSGRPAVCGRSHPTDAP